MDGIFVAYHNTAIMFGFEYFSREFMDERLFGGSVQGDRVFDRCVRCMEDIVSEITQCFPGLSVRCSFETSEQDGSLRIYVEPAEWDEETQGELPVTELFVTVTNYVNGNRVIDEMDFGIQEDDCESLRHSLEGVLRISREYPAQHHSIFVQLTKPERGNQEG